MNRIVPLEHEEQSELISWWSAFHLEIGISESLLFAIPNGGFRPKVTARNLKAEGTRKGIPDLFLAVPSNGYHGMFIEMKRLIKSATSPEQIEFIDTTNKLGYKSVICKGSLVAIKAIREYLSPLINK